MAKYRGKSLYVEFIHSAGTLVINTNYRSFKDNLELDMIDVSAGADVSKSYIAGLDDATFEVEYLDNNADGTVATVARRAMAVGNYGTLTWGVQGTAAGKPKRSCAAYVTAFDDSIEYDKEKMNKVSFQRDGAWIADFASLGSAW
jgi:hypothetical protein